MRTHTHTYTHKQWRWGEPALNPSVALTWVNGINYTNAEMEEQAQFLSSLFGCRVRPYYNPSLGWWLRDLTRVSYMYIRAPTEDPVVTGLAKHLKMVLREVGPKGRVVHLAHSGGALLTYLVAKYHLKEADRRRIDVINFGGARSITQKYFAKATNYYARNDPILLVNRRAMALMQQVMNDSCDGEVIYLKHNTSFVFLQGRSGDALTDHALIGPTYLTALNKEAAVFRRAYYRAYWLEGLTIAKPPEMGWGRYFRKRTAAATGFHNFFSNSTVTRFYYASSFFGAGARGSTGAGSDGSLASWTNSTRNLFKLPKRLRKYVKKRYYKLTSKALPTPVPVEKNTSSFTSWIPLPSLPAPFSAWLNRTQINETTTNVPLLPSPSTPAPPSLLKKLSNLNLNLNVTQEAALRVRKVRKAAARMTGMRHFFTSPTRKGTILALEAAAAAAAEAKAAEAALALEREEAKAAASSSSFFSFLRGRGTGSSGSKEEQERDGKGQEEAVEVPQLELTPPAVPKEEGGLKLLVEEESKKKEEEKETNKGEEEGKEVKEEEEAVKIEKEEVQPPAEPGDGTPAVPTVAVEAEVEKEEEEVVVAVVGDAPPEKKEDLAEKAPEERQEEGELLVSQAGNKEEENEQEKTEEGGGEREAETVEVLTESSEEKIVEAGAEAQAVATAEEEGEGEARLSSSSGGSFHRRRGGSNTKRHRLRIRRMKEEDPDLPLSAYLEQQEEEVAWEDEDEEGEEAQQGQQGQGEGGDGQQEDKEGGHGMMEVEDESDTDDDTDYGYYYDVHNVNGRYFDL